jgi:hypothetical protein
MKLNSKTTLRLLQLTHSLCLCANAAYISAYTAPLICLF